MYVIMHQISHLYESHDVKGQRTLRKILLKPNRLSSFSAMENAEECLHVKDAEGCAVMR